MEYYQIILFILIFVILLIFMYNYYNKETFDTLNNNQSDYLKNLDNEITNLTAIINNNNKKISDYQTQILNNRSNITKLNDTLKIASNNYLMYGGNMLKLYLEQTQINFVTAVNQLQKIIFDADALYNENNNNKKMLEKMQIDKLANTQPTSNTCDMENCNKVLDYNYKNGNLYTSTDFPICSNCEKKDYPYKIGEFEYIDSSCNLNDLDLSGNVSKILQYFTPSSFDKKSNCSLIGYTENINTASIMCKNKNQKQQKNKYISSVNLGFCTKPYKISNSDGFAKCINDGIKYSNQNNGVILNSGDTFWSSDANYGLKLEENGFLTIYTQMTTTFCSLPKSTEAKINDGLTIAGLAIAETAVAVGLTLSTGPIGLLLTTGGAAVAAGKAGMSIDVLSTKTKSYILPRQGPVMSTYIQTSPFNDPLYVQQHPGPYTLVLQDDGNLVIKDKNNQATWFSGRTLNLNIKTKAPYRIVLHTDGNLVTYDKNNIAVWGTGTYNMFPHNCTELYPIHIYGFYVGFPKTI